MRVDVTHADAARLEAITRHPFTIRFAADPVLWGPIIARALAVVGHLPARDRVASNAGTFFRPTPPDGSGRLRVGFAGECYYRHGGTETWHRTLLPRLAAHGVQAAGYAVLHSAEGDPAPLGVPLGVGVEVVRALARSVDVLVCWGTMDLCGHVPERGAADRPVVVAVNHGDGGIPYFGRVMQAIEPCTDHYVCVGSGGLGAVPEARRREAVVLPNAVDPERVRPTRSRGEVRAELGLMDGDICLLWPHRLSHEKRPELARALIAALGPPFVLAVAGSGPEPLPEQARVLRLGHRDDLGDLYAAADLVLSTSESEGFGLSMAEAVLAGVPLVATPVGVLAERCHWARTVSVAAGVDGWAAALRADWSDPEGRARRAARARDEARALLDPDVFAARWAEFLRSLAQERPEPALPSRARQVAGFARTAAAVVAHAAQTGTVFREQDEIDAILATCRACDHHRPSDGRCGKLTGCGCFVVDKARFAAAHCPLGKW